jgi:hypothetical protein
MPTKKQVKHLRKLQKLRLFLIFFVLAVVYWVFLSLSEVHKSHIKAKVQFVPRSQIFHLQEAWEAIGQIKVETTGFRILAHNIKPIKLEISEQWIVNTKNGEGYFLPNDYLKQWERSHQEFKFLQFEKDTLWLPLEQNYTKKIPVEIPLSVQFEPGYDWLSPPTISPDSIEVVASKIMLEKLDKIFTDTLVIVSQHNEFNAEIPLKEPYPNMFIKQKSVRLSGKIVPYTEKVIELPIKTVNLPELYDINLFPNTVQVTFQVPLELYKMIKVSDFEVQCDLENKDRVAGNGLLTPVLVSEPKEVQYARIQPEQVQYFLSSKE